MKKIRQTEETKKTHGHQCSQAFTNFPGAALAAVTVSSLCGDDATSLALLSLVSLI